jgi:Predicted membrane protein
MGQNSGQASSSKKNQRLIIIVLVSLIVLVAVLFLAKAMLGSKNNAVQQGGDITIVKSEITSTAKFFPYTSGTTKMEVIAVKAPDGTIRTALNTCQVCYDSGRGYYKQEGDVLVCQNCFNRFQISQLEEQKNGCNPVPILAEDKTETDTTITIPQKFLEEHKQLFDKWKKAE